MSNRISEAFAKGKAFIPFITCGDPSLEITEQLVYAMEEAGADLIELGIPFSDPTAEGPVIQEANVRALSGGVTTDKIFDMVVKIRKKTSIPMVFMTYANVVFSYGTERFIRKAAEIGMDGLILPDVPFEEKRGVRCGLQTVWSGADFPDRPHIPRSDHPDCKRGKWLRILRFLPWCNRNQNPDHHRYRSNGEAGKSCKGYSMCSGLRHLHPGAGKENGCPVRRCDCRLRHCENLCRTWRKLHPICKGLCKVYERRCA